MFPAARSLIPIKTDNDTYKDYLKWHNEFSTKFNERINAGRSMGSRSKNQQQYLDNAWKSPLFKDETRDLILKNLEASYQKVGQKNYVPADTLKFQGIEVNTK